MAEFQRQKTVLRVCATRCCKLPDRGVREHLPRTDDDAVAQYYEMVLEVPGSAEWYTTKKWHWRKRERAQDRKAAFSNATLFEFKRILVRSDNERTLLSLIERVMSNLTGVELVQCSWRQRPTRAARGSGVCGAGAPAVRPQHVEVRVEEKQKIHDERKTRIHEYSQPAET